VATLAGYGFGVQYLPVVNVPCTNGTANCSGGFNSTNYISNQPGVFNPDGLSCAGSTTDTIHPNNCGHRQMFQALQTDLGIVQSFAGEGAQNLAQNYYTANHTLVATDGIVYMGCSSVCTLTLPGGFPNSGPYYVVNNGMANVTIAAGSGANLENVPAALAPNTSMVTGNFGNNWWGYSNPNSLSIAQNTHTSSYTLTSSDGVIYMNGAGLTLTLPAGLANSGPYIVCNSGSSTVTIAAGAGAVLENIPTSFAPLSCFTINNFGNNWWGSNIPGKETIAISTGTLASLASGACYAVGESAIAGYGAGNAWTINWVGTNSAISGTVGLTKGADYRTDTAAPEIWICNPTSTTWTNPGGLSLVLGAY
jgi:hypothetical protein